MDRQHIQRHAVYCLEPHRIYLRNGRSSRVKDRLSYVYCFQKCGSWYVGVWYNFENGNNQYKQM